MTMIRSVGSINRFERLHRLAVTNSIAEVSAVELDNGAAVSGDGLRRARSDRENGMPTYRDYLSRLSQLAPQTLKKDKAREEEEALQQQEADQTPIGWLIPDQYLPQQDQPEGSDGTDAFVVKTTDAGNPSSVVFSTPDTEFGLGSDEEWFLTPFAA